MSQHDRPTWGIFLKKKTRRAIAHSTLPSVNDPRTVLFSRGT